MFFLTDGNDIPAMVEQDAAGAGGTLIYSRDVFWHNLSSISILIYLGILSEYEIVIMIAFESSKGYPNLGITLARFAIVLPLEREVDCLTGSHDPGKMTRAHAKVPT